MTPEQAYLKEHFLEPENRDGTQVSAELKAAWKVMLDILEEFIKVARKYDLKWSMEGGSLLGAVRHKGFIPWDDDIDVVMPRKDYDKLIKVLPGELPSHLYAQTTLSDSDFHIPHLMICDSRTTGIDIDHVRWKKHFNMGIRIDVLPLDGMPSAPIRALIRKYIIFMMNGVPRHPADWPRKSFLAKAKYRIGRLMFWLFGNKGLYNLREFPLRMLPMDRYEWCGSLCARNFWHPHSIRKTEWFREYKKVPFEYIEVDIPVDAERILTQQFGDWRTPVMGTSYHGTLILDPHTPYKTTLREKYGYESNGVNVDSDCRGFTEDFLQPEDRDGFHADSDLKKLWKAELDLLEEFIRICDKYDFRYCLDGGSLLGAVRHKGFIPWDDDIDVSLPREEFKKFLEVAPRELKAPLHLQYTTTEPEHYKAFAVIRNSSTTAIDMDWVERGLVFDMGVGIDIFPIDYVPDDESKFNRMINKAAYILDWYSLLFAKRKHTLKTRIKRAVFLLLYHLLGNGFWVKLRDSAFASATAEESGRCGNIAYNLNNKRAIWPKEIYAERIKVPFEYLDVWIPKGYETYLSSVYGKDWRTPIRGRGDHDSLVVDLQRSYKDVLVEKFGYKREWLEKLP